MQNELLSWALWVGLYAALIALGIAMLSIANPHRIKAAKICFILAAILISVRVLAWSFTMSDSFIFRFLGCVVIFGLIGAIANELVRFAAHTQELPPVKDSAIEAKAIPLEVNGERANLSFERITVHGVRELVKEKKKEGTIGITYRMRNDGKKPAYTRNVTFQAKVTQKYCLPMPLVFDNPTPNGERFTIYPDIPLDTYEKFYLHNFKITLGQAKDILAGKQYLFVFGFIEYDDVFEQPLKHDFAIHYKFKSSDASDLREPITVQSIEILCND